MNSKLNGLDALQYVSDDIILDAMKEPTRRPRLLSYIAAAAAVLVIGLAVFAVIKLYGSPDGEYSAFIPPKTTDEAIETEPAFTAEPSLTPVTTEVPDTIETDVPYSTGEPLPSEPPYTSSEPTATGTPPVTTDTPPDITEVPHTTPEPKPVKPEPVPGGYPGPGGAAYTYGSEQELVSAYTSGELHSAFYNLFTVGNIECYYKPKRIPEGEKLRKVTVTPYSIGFTYSASPSMNDERYVFEWWANNDPADMQAIIDRLTVYERYDRYYVVRDADKGLMYIVWAQDNGVFYAEMPSAVADEDIKSFCDAKKVMFPEPEPGAVDILIYDSLADLETAVRNNTSQNSLLWGIDGYYLIKKPGTRTLRSVSVQSDIIVMQYLTDDSDMVLLGMYREENPTWDWLMDRATSVSAYHSHTVEDGRILVLNASGTLQILFWIEDGTAFRMVMYGQPDGGERAQLAQLEHCTIYK